LIEKIINSYHNIYKLNIIWDLESADSYVHHLAK